MNYDTKVNVKHLHDFLALPEDNRRLVEDMNLDTLFAMNKDWLGEKEYTSALTNEEQTYLILLILEANTYVEHFDIFFYFTFPSTSPLHKGYMRIRAIAMHRAKEIIEAEYGFAIYDKALYEHQFLTMDSKPTYEIPFGYMPEE